MIHIQYYYSILILMNMNEIPLKLFLQPFLSQNGTLRNDDEFHNIKI